jgi:hypothetical protein
VARAGAAAYAQGWFSGMQIPCPLVVGGPLQHISPAPQVEPPRGHAHPSVLQPAPPASLPASGRGKQQN